MKNESRISVRTLTAMALLIAMSIVRRCQSCTAYCIQFTLDVNSCQAYDD